VVPIGTLKADPGLHRIGIGSPAAAKAVAHTVSAPSVLVRAAFALFVFSVPFESFDFLLSNNTFSLSRLVGILLVGSALTQFRTSFARPPAAFWFFLTYLLIVDLVGLSGPSRYWPALRVQTLTLLQLLLLFWIASNLLRFPRVAKAAITALAIATLLVALLDLAGVGRMENPDTRRISMFGEDPNSLAGVLSLGILAWIGGMRQQKGGPVRRTIYWLAPCAVIGATFTRTGSRGGIVALLGGALALLIGIRRGRRLSPRGWRVIVVMLVVAVGSVASQTNVKRWRDTLVERKLSDRDRIASMAIAMFLQRPMTGWGPVQHIEELGARRGPIRVTELGGRRGYVPLDTHNGLLWVLIEVGLVGSIPFGIGLLLCLRGAWRGRAGKYGVLPLALVICVVVINSSVTWNYRKLNWLILGLGVASAKIVETRPPNGRGTERVMWGPLKRVRGAG
jgi:O-antigen ligase